MNDRTEEIEALMSQVTEVLSGIPETPERPEAEPHTLLEIWAAVLSNIEHVEAQPVSMQMAARITSVYPQIKVQECGLYMTCYHSALRELRSILLDEIESDPDCFKYAEDDAVKNRHHYLNLLTQWQLQVQQWDKEWDCTELEAHIWLAAYADAGTFVLGKEGLVAHLDQINFEFTDEDAAGIYAVLSAE